MCGICGIVHNFNDVDFESVAQRVQTMMATMTHRGPDGTGLTSTPHGTFGHVRLAIVDVAGGAQPLFNEDGHIGIVFNGEVYNYLELRHDLLSKGHIFKTHTDTEVIIHLFEEYGELSFSMLIGMFAFAIWTLDDVYLVRDQIGIKPLYYISNSDSVLFASEMKSLLSINDEGFAFSEAGLRQYLTYRYAAGPQTVIKEIKKIPAAHFVRITGCHLAIKRYYNLADDVSNSPITEISEQVTDTIQQIIQSQLMGEVPVGLTLSGGLDSSAIAYYLNKLGASLETFNIGFPSVNEFIYSERVAREFSLNHTMVLMEPSELLKYLPKYLQAIDEPLADAACLPLFKLCEIIKEQITVVLSGEGGDEIFGGYPQYWLTCNSFKEANDSAFRFFLERSWYFLELDGYFQSGQGSHIIGREHFRGSLVTAMTNYDLHTWVPENLMMKADKILMAHSLEGRFPFLDLRIIRLAASLADADRVRGMQQGKWLFKNLMRPNLPHNIVDRPKMGFSVPIDRLLVSARDQVHAALTDSSPLDSIMNKRRVRQTMQNHFNGKQPAALLVWTLFILYQWVHDASLRTHFN